MKKLIALLLVVAFLCVSTIGCSARTTTPAAKPTHPRSTRQVSDNLFRSLSDTIRASRVAHDWPCCISSRGMIHETIRVLLLMMMLFAAVPGCGSDKERA